MARLQLGWRLRTLRTAWQRRADPAPNEVAPALLVQDVKVLGAALARQLYAAGLAGPGIAAPGYPVLQRLGGRLCRQADIEAPWLHHWCGRLHMVPVYHRKVWEDCFVAQALWEAGMLAPNRRGLGFAVGRETLPAFLAAQGAEVLASDLDLDDARAQAWHRTGQHAAAADHLFYPHFLDREAFDAKVRFRSVDMNAIPADLRQGEFDFLWSVCSLEHLGSIRAGQDFVLAAMACLRPGGTAVHTTEYKLDPDGRTLENGSTVLFQRRHIEALAARLEEAGHTVLPIDFDPGEGVFDRFIDMPPYADDAGIPCVPDAPHLRMALAGHPATSIGMIIRRAA